MPKKGCFKKASFKGWGQGAHSILQNNTWERMKKFGNNDLGNVRGNYGLIEVALGPQRVRQ